MSRRAVGEPPCGGRCPPYGCWAEYCWVDGPDDEPEDDEPELVWATIEGEEEGS